MNVTSVAGNTSGSTQIFVEPILTSGNSYKYKAATKPSIPNCRDVCQRGYTNWDGESDIIADSGQTMVVVEVDSGNKCVGVGTTQVVAAE
ncbi:MAG: hypothetical protein K1W22_18090 [Lachnospiraceae bacterium]